MEVLLANDIETILEYAAVGIAQFLPDGRFSLVNPRLCSMLGYTREELLARTFQEITFPDDPAHCLSLNARVFAGEIPSYAIEKRFVRPDGSLVWTRITVSAIRDAFGQPRHFVGIAEDISKEYEAHAARFEAES